MFDVRISNAETVVARTVNSEGRIPRMSEHKGKQVYVVIPESLCTPTAMVEYPYQVKLDTGTYSSDARADVSGDDEKIVDGEDK